jgi:hypothetical protein
MDKVDEVVRYLRTAHGRYHAIARETGLKPRWISALADGTIRDPGWRRLEKLWSFIQKEKQQPRDDAAA